MNHILALKLRLDDLRIKLRVHWQRLRFGEIRQEIRSIDGGVASEVAYYGRNGVLVGYWAYGSFDPWMPYQG